LSWLGWHSSVDCDENFRLGPVHEWRQPGIGHGSWSIIMFVVSRSCRLMGREVSVKALLGDVTRMVGRVACGLVSSGKSLMCLLRFAVREAG
jgi:hypothetical protein